MVSNNIIKKKLVLIGGGGHCKSVLDTALKVREYSEIVIIDTALEKGLLILGCQVVGNDDMLPVLREQGFSYAFVTVGSIENAGIRKMLTEKAASIGFIFPVIRDPSAVVSEFAQIGKGTFIGKNAIINADVKIGNHCIINSGAIIEHECIVNDFSHVAIGATLCGNVCVGNESFIGAGCTLIQGVKIGRKVVIGAGSTVLSDVEDNKKVYGIVNRGGIG